MQSLWSESLGRNGRGVAERQEMFKTNRALVWHIINREFSGHTRRHSDDMEQVGTIALWKATGGWEECRGKFSTYACRSIRRSILGLLNDQELEVVNFSDFNFPVIDVLSSPSREESRIDELRNAFKELIGPHLKGTSALVLQMLLEGRRWKEIASLAGYSSAKSARTAFRKRMSRVIEVLPRRRLELLMQCAS